MKIPKKVVETIDAKYVRFHAKMRDEGTYVLLDENFKEVASHESYVPMFFPCGQDGKENHYGDYVDLFIDLETGQIVNWRKNINPENVAIVFGLIEKSENE